MKSAVLKKGIKNINFGLLVDEIHDFDIVHHKYVTLYDTAKQYLANISYIYNGIINRIKTKSLLEYVTLIKDLLYEHKELMARIKKIIIFQKDDQGLVIERYKMFCKSPIVAYIMFTNSAFLKHDLSDNDWIIKSLTRIDLFDNVDIPLALMYRTNKGVVGPRVKKLKLACEAYYSAYVLPNFNMEKAIDGICGYLRDLDKKREVKCDMVLKYIRKTYDSKIIDIEELNTAYLETNNKAVFVSIMFDKFLNTGEDAEIDPKTATQIQGLLVFLRKKNNDPKIASTLNFGETLLKGM
jgi:hypothetical protein